MEKSGYVNVDELQAQTSLEEAAARCSATLDIRGQGKEVRMDCPFGCAGDHCGRKELAINVENPQKVFMCHAYSCKFRGNLLTLMHGWLTGAKPTGNKLSGAEFQRVKKVLANRYPAERQAPPAAKSPETAESPPPVPLRNVPLADSLEEKVRELHNIDEKFLVDVADMNPAAAAYVRRHQALSPESMRKWRVGYLPNDGGGDKRGWSLRGNIIYPVLSEDGKVLSWVGRDTQYEAKELEFSRIPPAERDGKDPPAKHRFPKGFHRGLELFGQQASRLKELGYREFIAAHGIVVVEGFNDVIGLDNIGVPAVGVMSNRITEAQVEKIARWARKLADGRVTLMLDCEQTGSDGAKEALWEFAERQLDVRLAWSPKMHGGTFAERQPESLTRKEFDSLLVSGERC
jgi:5S rRNA maturation endonuclease (ribonuclease M5)